MKAGDLHDRARQHFAARAGTTLSIEVPELGWTVWYRPVLTLAERATIAKADERGLDHRAAMTLITLARDEDGEKVFRPADAARIVREWDSALVARIVGEMIEHCDEGMTEAQAEGN